MKKHLHKNAPSETISLKIHSSNFQHVVLAKFLRRAPMAPLYKITHPGPFLGSALKQIARKWQRQYNNWSSDVANYY